MRVPLDITAGPVSFQIISSNFREISSLPMLYLLLPRCNYVCDLSPCSNCGGWIRGFENALRFPVENALWKTSGRVPGLHFPENILLFRDTQDTSCRGIRNTTDALSIPSGLTTAGPGGKSPAACRDAECRAQTAALRVL